MSSKVQRFANAKTAPAAASLQEADAAIYGQGAIAVPDSGKQVAKPLPIVDIFPDPAQPRRVVPSQARAVWNGEPAGIVDVLKSWMYLAQEERGREFSADELYALLQTDTDYEWEGAIGPLESSFLDLVGLANDIRRNKLTNPVTVVRRGTGYQLETGERRWLAYHLLYAVLQDEQWSRIPAREVQEANVWRQASENNIRVSLNAIGRARQLALLLMDIYAKDGTSFQAYSEVVQTSLCDRPFYAQVADGEAFRIPRNHGTAILTAMGLKNSVQLRQYRALLRLPDDIWLKADDENWDEFKVRSHTVTAVTVSSNSEGKKSKPDEVMLLDRVKRVFTSAPKDDEGRRKALEDITQLQRLLEAFKAELQTGHNSEDSV